MSKSTPLTGCLAVFHDEIDCEAAGLAVANSCPSCWIQQVDFWSEPAARERVRQDMLVEESPDAGTEQDQIEAGVAWLRDLWQDRHQAS